MGKTDFDDRTNVRLFSQYNCQQKQLRFFFPIGGEGCIISAGASLIGVGSDIGGSIRMPAFFNGVFGHRPSKGKESAPTVWAKTRVFRAFPDFSYVVSY